MTGKSNSLEEDLLRLIFNGDTILGLAQNDASPLTNLYIALHSSSPGDDGAQSTNECSYGGYVRMQVARSSGGWIVSETSPGQFEAVNVSQVQFPSCTSGSQTATHVSIGTDAFGSGQILYHTQLGSPLSISTGVAPTFASGTLRVSEG